MFSLTTIYSLRAVVVLARKKTPFLGRAVLSEVAHIPHDYLQKVMSDLESAGYIETRRGPGGGYRLTKPPEEISLWDILAATGGIQRIETCPFGFEFSANLCPLHHHLDQAIANIQSDFSEIKLSEFCSDSSMD